MLLALDLIPRPLRVGQRREKIETKKWFRFSLAQFRF